MPGLPASGKAAATRHRDNDPALPGSGPRLIDAQNAQICVSFSLAPLKAAVLHDERIPAQPGAVCDECVEHLAHRF